MVVLQLLKVAGSLMDRPTAKEDMKNRTPRILDVYSKDLDSAKVTQVRRKEIQN